MGSFVRICEGASSGIYGVRSARRAAYLGLEDERYVKIEEHHREHESAPPAEGVLESETGVWRTAQRTTSPGCSACAMSRSETWLLIFGQFSTRLSRFVCRVAPWRSPMAAWCGTLTRSNTSRPLSPRRLRQVRAQKADDLSRARTGARGAVPRAHYTLQLDTQRVHTHMRLARHARASSLCLASLRRRLLDVQLIRALSIPRHPSH